MTYTEKFHLIIKSWLMGLLTGIPTSAGLSLLTSGFEFDTTFWVVLPFTLVASIWVMATVFAIKYTAGFGCSCIPRAISGIIEACTEPFTGVPIFLWLALLIIGLGATFWLIGLLIFVGLMPWQTLYYGIRCLIEKT